MAFADVNNVSLRYQVQQGAGPTIVLIHEMGGALESWDYVWPHLKGQSALRMDLRGFGQSEKHPCPVTLDELRDDVIALLNHLHITGPVVVAGVAVGAAVAIAVADALGDKVAGLLAMAPATGIPAERKEAVAGLAEMLRNEGMRHFVETDTAPKAWPENLIPRGAAFDLFLGLQLACDPAVIAETYHMLSRIELEPVLNKLECTTILAAGEYDIARPPELVGPMVDTMKNARFVALKTGHFMPLQSPDLVAGLIEQFCSEISAAQ